MQGIKQHLDDVPALVTQIDNVCTQACGELQETYNLLKNQNDE